MIQQHQLNYCQKETTSSFSYLKVRKRAKIRNRYNQAPHLTERESSLLDITNESQEVSPFPTGDHKASINRRA